MKRGASRLTFPRSTSTSTTEEKLNLHIQTLYMFQSVVVIQWTRADDLSVQSFWFILREGITSKNGITRGNELDE